MAGNCKYEYLDKDGISSQKYAENIGKYGKDAAEALFISDTLKKDTPIKWSKDLDSDKKLRNNMSYDELFKLGYTASPSAILNEFSNTKVKDDMLSAMALNIKARQLLIEAKKSKNETLDANDFINISDFGQEYRDIMNKVRSEYLNDPLDRTSFQVKSGKELDFANLRVDAKNLLELQTKKIGTQEHEFLKSVWEERAKLIKNQKSNYFEDYFKNAETDYRSRTTDSPDRLTLSTLSSLGSICRDIDGYVTKYSKEWGVNDIELLPEVSIMSDTIKYKDKPIQGHIDLLLYSPSTKKCVVFDYKTKSEKSFANYEKGYGDMHSPFADLPKSAENSTAVQVGMYSLILKENYGLDVQAQNVVLITHKFSDGNIATPKIDGKREWKTIKIDYDKSKIQLLTDVKGLLASPDILNIKEPITLGLKSPDSLIHEMYDGKLSTVVSSKENFVNGQEPYIKDMGNGVFKWFNNTDFTRHVVRGSREEVRKGIGEWYEEYNEIKKRAAQDLVKYFNNNEFPDKSIWKSEKYLNRANALLRRFDKSTHTLETYMSIPGLGKDIIVARDKYTGDTTLISIGIVYNNDYSFGETIDDKAKTTIFGKIIDDATVFKKYGKTAIPAADVHSISHLRLALIAAELKTRDPLKYGKISSVVSTSLADNKPYSYSNITTQMGYLKEMVNLMKANKITVPDELSKVVNTPELSGKDAFKINYFEEFANTFAKNQDPLKDLINSGEVLSKYKAEKQREKLALVLKNYQQDQFNGDNFDKVESELSYYVEEVFGALLTKNKTPEGVQRDPMFVAANRAWLAFKNWMSSDNPSYKGSVLSAFNSLTTVGDANATNAHRALHEYSQKSTDVIIEVITEHQRLQQELIKESKDITLLDQVFDTKAYQKLFESMLVDGYTFDKNNIDNWMKFKDPDKEGSNLSPAQKDYIRFYTKTVKENSKLLFPGDYKLMYEPTGEDVYGIKKWDEFNIPIIPGDISGDIDVGVMSAIGVNNVFSDISKIWATSNKVSTEASQDVSTPWKYNSFFPSQVDTAQGKGSRYSRNLLNITDDNQVIENKRNVELNPIAVLNLMTMEAARRQYMRLAKFATFSINAELIYKDMYAGVDTQALRSIISNCVTLQIEGRPDTDDPIAKTLDTIKKVAQTTTFFANLKTVASKFTFDTTQIASQSIANLINKNLFKGTNKYENKDIAWSSKHILTSFGEQLMVDLGMHTTAIGQFSDSQYDETRKKLAFQTKHGYWALKTLMEQSVQSLILAQMHKEGINESCFDKDEKTGRYKYDETKDPRFYVYDKSNPLFSKNEEPITDNDKTKYALWLAHRQTLAGEGGLNSDGTMRRPFINNQLLTMKDYAIRLVGAVDNTEAQAMEIGAMGRALMAFQRIMRTKITNYIGSTKDATFKEGNWALDEDGEAKWIEQRYEGMIQSFSGLIKDLYKSGGDFKAVMANSTDVRKRQASKLMADTILTGIMLALAGTLKELIGNDPVGKEISKGVEHAASQAFPLAALHSSLTKSPLPAVAIALNTATGAVRTINYAITGDLDKTLKSADKTMSGIGAYRLGKSLFQELFDTVKPEKE